MVAKEGDDRLTIQVKQIWLKFVRYKHAYRTAGFSSGKNKTSMDRSHGFHIRLLRQQIQKGSDSEGSPIGISPPPPPPIPSA